MLSDRFNLLARRYLGEQAPLPSVFLVRRDGTLARIERGYAKDASQLLLADIQAALGHKRPRAGSPVTRVAVIAGPTASGKTAARGRARARASAARSSAPTRSRSTAGSTSAPPSRPARSARPCRTTCSTWPSRGRGWTRRASCALADAAIAGIAARGRLPIVAGGTGLYLRALLHGVVDAPGRDPALRARLEAEAARARAARRSTRGSRPSTRRRRRAIRPNDLVRIVRALEIAAGGRTPDGALAAHALPARTRYRCRLLALDPPREELHARIDARVRGMFAGGSSTRRARSPPGSAARCPPKLPIGYAEAVDVLRGALARAEAIRACRSRTAGTRGAR